MKKSNLTIELLEEIRKCLDNEDIVRAIDIMYDLANEYERVAEILEENILPCEKMQDFIEDELREYGWESLLITLGNVIYTDDPYYLIDFDNNISNININDVEGIYDFIRKILLK